MKKKYRRGFQVILGIFIAAVLCVGLAAFVIYQNGLRYMKSDAGIKYFGSVDTRTDNITNGRLWFESDAASISLQKFYIVEAMNEDTAVFLPDQRLQQRHGDAQTRIERIDILYEINYAITSAFTDYFPMNNFLFNTTDERILFRNETFESLIKSHELAGNYIISGEIWTIDGASNETAWILSPANNNPRSFSDFEVVREDNAARKFRGDIIEFMQKEPVFYAAFELSGGNIIKVYASHDNIYRLSYDRGPKSGDLYIGPLNNNFEKHGRGLYFHGNNNNTGDIYFGDFQNGAKTGFAQFLSGGGDNYTGEMLDGRKHGEGTFRWTDGSSYSGMFYDNMKHGFGVNIFADGSVYEGDYVNNVKHGRGKYIWAGGDVYEGEFVNDLYQGFGRYTWASGDFYEGDFYYNTLHGEGTYVWFTGRTYRGLFEHGRMIQRTPSPSE